MLLDVYHFEMSMEQGGKSYSDQSRLSIYLLWLSIYLSPYHQLTSWTSIWTCVFIYTTYGQCHFPPIKYQNCPLPAAAASVFTA